MLVVVFVVVLFIFIGFFFVVTSSAMVLGPVLVFVKFRTPVAALSTRLCSSGARPSTVSEDYTPQTQCRGGGVRTLLDSAARLLQTQAGSTSRLLGS